jgi:hypothetical protein
MGGISRLPSSSPISALARRLVIPSRGQGLAFELRP